MATELGSNKLWGGLLIGLLALVFFVRLTASLQLVAIHVPAVDRFFEVEPLNAGQLLLAILKDVATFAALEAKKRRRRGSVAETS